MYKFSTSYYNCKWKLQKMVHDMKKNESGIINKFKKFQNEQVALICKTGKDTWDRLKKKPPPSLPQRDYASEHADNEEEQWSDDFDSDYENPDDHSDSEMYVVPSEENPDDSYEPPPSEQEKKKIPSAFPISRGEYADNRTSHQQLPPINKPLPSTPSPAVSRPKKPSMPSLPLPSPAAKPKVPPKPKECSDDEDNYIVPVDNDDDNYIEPTESSTSLPTRSPVNRFMKTTKSAPPTSPKPSLTSDMQEVYEVPEEEEKPSPPPVTRFTKPLPSMPAQNTEHSHMHNMTRESPKLDTSRTMKQTIMKKIIASVTHKNPDFLLEQLRLHYQGACEKKTSNAVNSPKNLQQQNDDEVPAKSFRFHPFQVVPKKVPEAANRSLGTSPHSSISSMSSTADQDAGVHSKAWYAATCDRKTAEDALYRSNKRFNSVAEIVENHQHTSLVLIDSQNNTKDSTKLKHIVRVS
ncbi:hypothetical protein QYF61_027375 [Mycteria americana]|uniref:Uncharacterized protein n=1 Tax=Mycteria americana TaxID=33587 RepID=A0AAN7S8Q1_MYCAM|nr:hypothetical protein QYF61_027375 [Mycteria americana]